MLQVVKQKVIPLVDRNVGHCVASTRDRGGWFRAVMFQSHSDTRGSLCRVGAVVFRDLEREEKVECNEQLNNEQCTTRVEVSSEHSPDLTGRR